MSQAKSSSGRETSFGLPTSGYSGWMPVLLKDGSHSKRPPQEGYKNVIDNREYIPPGGWNDDPPCPTGEPVRQASDAYRRGYDQIKWSTTNRTTGAWMKELREKAPWCLGCDKTYTLSISPLMYVCGCGDYRLVEDHKDHKEADHAG